MTAVALKFDKAACDYDQAARLQRDVADQLLQLLPQQVTQPRLLLDLGTGTGYCAHALKKRFPSSKVNALDFAWRMLQQARQKSPLTPLIYADAHHLPLGDQCYDLLVTNLMLQWCDTHSVLQEMQRVLKPGAYALLSTFADKTLHELRASWARIDQHQHVNRFIEANTLQQLCEQSGFVVVQSHSELRQQYYPNLRALLQELKCLGANHVQGSHSPGLLSRARWQQLQTYYSEYCPSSDIIATYEVLYYVIRKA